MMRMMPLKANLSIVISRYNFDFFSLSRAVILYSKLCENETLLSSERNFFERLWSLNLNSSNFKSSWAKIFWMHSFVEKIGKFLSYRILFNVLSSKFIDLPVCQVEMIQSPCHTICSMRLLGAFSLLSVKYWYPPEHQCLSNTNLTNQIVHVDIFNAEMT